MTKTPDVETLIEMRDYHRLRAQKYDEAIALLVTAQREAQRVRKMLARVAGRVIDEHELAEPRRGRGRPPASTPSPKALASQRQRERRRRGMRPIDQARRILADAQGAPVTRETFAARMTFPKSARAGQQARMLGLVLSKLAQAREVKTTADGGVVATARLVAPASVNGASA